MDPDGQDGPDLPPDTAEFPKLVKAPASVRKGLLISAFLPGMGEVYQGNVAKGIRMTAETAVFIVLSILTSRIFFPDGHMLIHILHSTMMLCVIGLWLYGMIRTVQFYEAEIRLWRAEKGIPSIRKRSDIFSIIRNRRAAA